MAAFTLDDVQSLLQEAKTARELFARATYQDLIRATLPDRNGGDPRAEALFKLIQKHYHGLRTPPLTVRGRQRTYTLWRPLGTGDVADVHFATAVTDTETAAEAYYALKVSRVPEGQRLLENERNTLTHLQTAANATTYQHYLPALVESFPAGGAFPRRVNVFRHELGFTTLEQVHARRPLLEGRHLAWIFNRLLTVLGFCHRHDTIHGAVLPCHVMIDAAGHGLQLVGWGHAVAVGRRITTISRRYGEWYPPEVLTRQAACPATDLFMAARCLMYLAGGDPLTNAMPDHVPASLQRFLGTLLLDAPRMRPDDAWGLFDDLAALLRQLYGPPKFHPLTLT